MMKSFVSCFLVSQLFLGSLAQANELTGLFFNRATVIGTAKLQVRTLPGRSAPIVKNLKRGDRLEVAVITGCVDEKTGQSVSYLPGQKSKAMWCFVRSRSGKPFEGYVDLQYLKVEELK